jgi:hypothetical protein
VDAVVQAKLHHALRQADLDAFWDNCSHAIVAFATIKNVTGFGD